MLAWIMSPRGSVATAATVGAVLTGALVAPRFLPVGGNPPSQTAGSPSSASTDARPQAASPAPATTSTPAADAVPPPRLEQQASLSPSAGAAATTASPIGPAFDIVRVEPSGDTVVAGRAAPGSKVALLDRGTVVATVTADDAGQFAILPPMLAGGSHYLTLQTEQDGKSLVSQQSVAVSVNTDRTSQPMVALMSPDQAVRVLSDGSQATASANRVAAEPAKASAALPVAIQSVETAGNGTLMASGVAKAGSQCRLYLNGAYLADVTAGKDGRWSVKVEKGMRPGKYVVRADQLEANGGKVINRAEVPFDFPVSIGTAERELMAKATAPAAAAAGLPSEQLQVASAAGNTAPQTGQVALPAQAAAAAIVKELQTATVIRGDSLWRISRKMLGHGVHYTEIYASNSSQIRDPRLIYPGQVFVMPNHAVQ